MNPKYLFFLDGSPSNPRWGENLAKVYSKQSGEMFFRASLNNPLRYIGSEYSYIVGKSFDWEFSVEITYSTDNGATYSPYWSGKFKKEDCKVDMDTMVVEVTPSVQDAYTKILESIDKEFNLVNLEPRLQAIRAAKRAAWQLYIAGQPTIFTFVSGMYWEASCTSEDDDTKIQNDYHFAQITNKLIAATDQVGGMPELFEGTLPSTPNTGYVLTAANGYKFSYAPQPGGGEVFEILDNNSNILYLYNGTSDYSGYPREVTLAPFGGTGDSIQVSVRNMSIYSRLILDTESFDGTVHIDLNDLGGINTNYRYVCPYPVSSSRITYSTALTNTPTKYGMYMPNQYYERPTVGGVAEVFPVTPSAWGRMSVWVDAATQYDVLDQQGRALFMIKNAYPLGAAIDTLVEAIDPTLRFSESASSSTFLYGNTPMEENRDKGYFIIPKTNITNSNYDNPSQRGSITLRQIFDLLRDAFRCYWFIDGTLVRVEHIEWFRRGGSYNNTPLVGIDLTTDQTVRNNKTWAFALNKYSYNKSEIPGRYTFKWMDEETEPFDGTPIEMLNSITQEPRGGREEMVTIQNFSSDLDYLLLNPNEISKDGFVILKAGEVSLVDSNNPISVYAPDMSPLYALATIMEYKSMPNELVFVRITFTPPSWSPQFTLQLIACDANDNVLCPLTGAYPYGGWDASQGHYLQLPAGTAKIKAIFTGGTVELFEFTSSTYLSVLYYDYHPDGYGTPRHRLMQNGEMAFAYMQKYYVYDLPSEKYQIDQCYWQYYNSAWYFTQGIGTAIGVKRTKVQEVSFPSDTDPNTNNLIKTDIGSGNIENITLNLSSRNAKVTLSYDPTQ